MSKLTLAASLLAVLVIGAIVGVVGRNALAPGPKPTSTPFPTATPAPTATPTPKVPNASAALTSVKTITCWGSAPSNIAGCPSHAATSPGPCYQGSPIHPDTQWSPQSGCPVTGRLERRLRQNPTSGRGGGADPICRCQNVPTRLDFNVLKKSSGRDVIKVVWIFGTSNPTHIPNPAIDFVVVRQGGSWLVDDTYCGGYPSTSIYNTPVAAC